jgi:hypothetical protein
MLELACRQTNPLPVGIAAVCAHLEDIGVMADCPLLAAELGNDIASKLISIGFVCELAHLKHGDLYVGTTHYSCAMGTGCLEAGRIRPSLGGVGR